MTTEDEGNDAFQCMVLCHNQYLVKTAVSKTYIMEKQFHLVLKYTVVKKPNNQSNKHTTTRGIQTEQFQQGH